MEHPTSNYGLGDGAFISKIGKEIGSIQKRLRQVESRNQEKKRVLSLSFARSMVFFSLKKPFPKRRKNKHQEGKKIGNIYINKEREREKERSLLKMLYL